MIVLADSTAIIHFDSKRSKMNKIIAELGITEIYCSRVGYLELLSGASENSKIYVRKVLNSFKLLEFDNNAIKTAAKLAMRYRVSSQQGKDFLIAATAVANKLPLLTENDKHFPYKELEVIAYRIN